MSKKNEESIKPGKQRRIMKFRSQPKPTLTPTDEFKSLKVGTKEAAHSSSCPKSTKGSSNLCFGDPQMSWVLAFRMAFRHVSNCRNCPWGKLVPHSQLKPCCDSTREVPTFFHQRPGLQVLLIAL